MNRNKHKIRRISLLVLLLAAPLLQVFAGAPEKGLSAADFLRQVAIVSIILAFVGLLFVEFKLKASISRSAYKWLLFLGLFIFPLIAMIGATSTLMEETTTVASCASCHNMHAFVHDLGDPESASLAARHYKNRYIPENQCYSCHTGYGIHGTLESKRDGFRHWLMYVTNTWEEPVTFKGSYQNSNCTDCHAGTPKFLKVNSHEALKDKLKSNEVSCTSCHGPVHPTPMERDKVLQKKASIWQKEDQGKLQAVQEYVKEIAGRSSEN